MFLNRSLAFFLCGVAVASGQQPEGRPPGEVTPPGIPAPNAVPVPGNIPLPNAVPPIPGEMPVDAANAAAAGNPEAALPNPSLGETKITTDINEPKLTGDSLANLYRKYTGRRVIVALAAQKAEFSFVQEASETSPLTFATATNLLIKAAVIEGFVFVPDEQIPGLDVLTLAASGIRPTAIGLKTYSEKDKLPDTDAVISYLMILDHLKPAEAQNVFTQIVGTFGAYGGIVPVPNVSGLIITENTSLIRRCIELKEKIDKPSSQIDSEFIDVEFADVTEVAGILTDLFSTQQSGQTTANTQRIGEIRGNVPGSMPPPGGPQGSESGGSAEAVPVKIVPDPRTNRIFAMGRPVDLTFVRKLTKDFDRAANQNNFFRRKLHFLAVADFLPIAGDALSRYFAGSNEGGSSGGGAQGAQGGGAQQGGAQQGGRSRGGQSRNSGGNSGGNNNSAGANFGGGMGGGGGGGSSRGGGSGGGGGGGEGPNLSSAPTSVLIGRTLLVADNITNSIIVQGPPVGIAVIEKLLSQLDVRPDQVMISTVIGQLALTDNFSVGMDYLRLGGDVVGRGGSGAGPALPILGTIVDAIAGSPAVGTPGAAGYIPEVPAQRAGSSAFKPGNLAGSGLQLYGKVGNNLSVYLSALQARTDFTVVSRGSIFTSNNKEGFIKSGERIAIPTGSNSFGSGGASTQVDYEDVALELAITPLINSENEITMQISLVNDEVGEPQLIAGAGSNGTALTVPGIITREILTTVTVPNNETVVLGGLITTRSDKTKSGIPVLSSIPYLGSLFGSTSTNKKRNELMVFIQPSVVRNEDTLNAVQLDMDSRYKIAPKTRGMSESPGVLPPVGAVNPATEPTAVAPVAVAPTPRATAIKIPAAPANPNEGTLKKKPKLGPAHRR